MLAVWFLEGCLVGFGAILPGVSGGALCAAFDMYKPLIDCLAHPFSALKKHGLMLGMFVLGIGAGFVGLSGVAAWCLGRNAPAVCCAFAGFIAGTLPSLWHTAGTHGRTHRDVFAGVSCFMLLLAVFFLLGRGSLDLPKSFGSFVLCGVLWGLSLIVPGLSSSSLLLFFGLYEPMLAGIASFDFGVIVPLGIGLSACVLLLAKAVDLLYKKHFAFVSHAVLGIVFATAVSIVPYGRMNIPCAVAVICGASMSRGLEKMIANKCKA